MKRDALHWNRPRPTKPSSRRLPKLLLAALLVGLLAACGDSSPTAYTPPTLVPLQTAPPANPSPTPRPSPTTTPLPTRPPATATATPTLTVTPIPPPTETPIPGPTLTPMPTPTSVYTDMLGRVETGTFPSQILGRENPYRIYLPPGYDACERAFPVLYLLHGYPFDESHWDRLGIDEAADAGIRSDAYPPFIIVLPNGDPAPEGIYVNTSGGDYSVEGLVVNELIPFIDQQYCTWAAPEGRAIGGISRGGVWSLEIAFRRPDLLGAVGAHSAAISLNYPHPAYDPFNLLEEPAVASLRIWLDAGDEDWARTGTGWLHDALDQQGIPHQYVIGQGAHVDGYWSSMLPTYLAFYTAAWPRDAQ